MASVLVVHPGKHSGVYHRKKGYVDEDVKYLGARSANAMTRVMGLLCMATPEGHYFRHGKAESLISGAPTAILNAAVNLTVDAHLSSLRTAASEVSRAGVPWSIRLRADPDAAVWELAAQHGLTKAERFPLMSSFVTDLRIRGWVDSDIEFRRLNSSHWRLYSEILEQGFGMHQGTLGSFMGGSVMNLSGFQAYVAEECGMPIGTAFGVVHRGAVGIVNIAVISSARGRGIGRGLAERVLTDGMRAGADVAFLSSSFLSYPLYESMGFRVVEMWTQLTAPTSDSIFRFK